MPSGVPKGENCQVDMGSKAGELFSAEDAHPTGTGGAGVLAKYEPLSLYLKRHVHQIPHKVQLRCCHEEGFGILGCSDLLFSDVTVCSYFITCLFALSLYFTGSGSLKAFQPAWLKSGLTSVECPFDRGPVL